MPRRTVEAIKGCTGWLSKLTYIIQAGVSFPSLRLATSFYSLCPKSSKRPLSRILRRNDLWAHCAQHPACQLLKDMTYTSWHWPEDTSAFPISDEAIIQELCPGSRKLWLGSRTALS